MKNPILLKIIYLVAICACFAVGILWDSSSNASTDYCRLGSTNPCIIVNPAACPRCGNFLWGTATKNMVDPPTFHVASSATGGPFRQVGAQNTACYLQAECVSRLDYSDVICRDLTGECDIPAVGAKCFKLTPGPYSPASLIQIIWEEVEEPIDR